MAGPGEPGIGGSRRVVQGDVSSAAAVAACGGGGTAGAAPEALLPPEAGGRMQDAGPLPARRDMTARTVVGWTPGSWASSWASP